MGREPSATISRTCLSHQGIHTSRLPSAHSLAGKKNAMDFEEFTRLGRGCGAPGPPWDEGGREGRGLGFRRGVGFRRQTEEKHLKKVILLEKYLKIIPVLELPQASCTLMF